MRNKKKQLVGVVVGSNEDEHDQSLKVKLVLILRITFNPSR